MEYYRPDMNHFAETKNGFGKHVEIINITVFNILCLMLPNSEQLSNPVHLENGCDTDMCLLFVAIYLVHCTAGILLQVICQ